ncbi:MAG: P-II family nitrogen regulator [Actinomycetota bacterium]
MNTVSRRLVTIIAESVIEQRLIADVKKCGAKGYSVGHVRGEGQTGGRALDITGSSLRLETVVTDAVADAILSMLGAEYFDRYAVVAWVTPVSVARPERF